MSTHAGPAELSGRFAAARSSLPYVPAAGIVVGAGLSAAAVGALIAYDAPKGIALLVALCYFPLALLNLPVAIAAWLPTTFLSDLPGVATASNAAAVVVAIAWLGGLRAHRSGGSAMRLQLAALGVFVVWLALSLTWAERPGEGIGKLLYWMAAVAVFAIIATMDLDARQLRLLVAAYVAGAVISVLIGLVGGIGPETGLSAITEQEGRLQGATGDPNYLAATIVPALAMTAGLASTTRAGARRVALVGAMVLLAIGLAATGSRGGLLAAVVAMLVALPVVRHGRAYVVVLIALVLGVGTLWFASTPDAWKHVTTTADAGHGRGSLWRVAGRITADHPAVGVGLDQFQVHAPRYVRSAGKLDYVANIAERPHVVHNVYLELLVETGPVGLLLLLGVAAGSLTACLRAARLSERQGDHAFAALSRSLFVAVIAALVASFFISDGTQFQLWALLSLGPAALATALGRGRLEPSRRPEPGFSP
jgi:O-antigen ligase